MESDLFSVMASTKYPIEAFAFVNRGLEFTVRHIHGEPAAGQDAPDDSEVQDVAGEESSRHISGKDLCQGLRDYAIEQYGLMARGVLRKWNIHACEDFGHIVFAMVDAGLMHKTDDDSIHDFIGVFEFAQAFRPSLELSETG